MLDGGSFGARWLLQDGAYPQDKAEVELPNSAILSLVPDQKVEASAVLSHLWLRPGMFQQMEEGTFFAGALSLRCARHRGPRPLVARWHPAPCQAFAFQVGLPRW